MDRDATKMAEPEVLITRELNFPRELVFDAWTRPDYLMQWYALFTPASTIRSLGNVG